MKLFISILLLLAASFVSAENIVTTGKIKHNGLDANGGLETIHQDVVGGAASVTNWYFEVCEGHIPGFTCLQKYGLNQDIDSAITYETIWHGQGSYTGFNATVAETIEVFSSSANDAGALLSSGTATDGSLTTLIDLNATFVSDGVAIGDVVLNDTDISHGVVIEVTSEIILTVARFDKGGVFNSTVMAGDIYRVATPASTGAAVIELLLMLDGDLANETTEYIILNGTAAVDTAGTYRRQSRAGVIIAGSTGSNIGDITSRQKTTTANVFMLMPAGFNRTMISAYTIPSDVEGHIVTWFADLAGKVSAICIARLRIRHVGEVFVVQEAKVVGAAPRNYLLPKDSLSPGSDMEIQASCDTNNTGVAAGFDVVLSTD